MERIIFKQAQRAFLLLCPDQLQKTHVCKTIDCIVEFALLQECRGVAAIKGIKQKTSEVKLLVDWGNAFVLLLHHLAAWATFCVKVSSKSLRKSSLLLMPTLAMHQH